MQVGSNNEKRVLNTSNLILEVNHNHYTSDKRYASRFTDLGVAYVNDILYGYVWSNFEDSVLYVKDGTNVIGDEAFMGAKNLTEVILPASVKVQLSRLKKPD